jgi:CBS domain-containing protein
MSSRYSHLERRIASEQQTFALPLRSLLRGEPVVCEEHLPIRGAAGLMRQNGVGSVVVVDSGRRPVGIITSHDVVGIAADDATARPVSERMTRDPVSLPAHAFAFEAALMMTSRRIRHVLVMDEGRLLGVVSERDLFSLQRLGLGEITMEIRLAEEIGVLAKIAAEVRKLAAAMVEHGVAAPQLMSLVSALNDCVSHRAIDIVRRGHDLERISWCWLAFGSEGRLEQTFSSDQDNGLLFTAHGRATPAQVRERLLPFARQVNEALDACGFPLCKGNVMASNPQLCRSLEEWRSKMGGWIEASLPDALLEASICFDFRPIYGDASLSQRLRAWVHERVRAYPIFLRHMAENALQATPPLGRFGRFLTEDVPGAKGTIDLKLHGARIFIDAARVFALAHAIPQTNTAERLRGVPAAMGVDQTEAGAWVDAFFAIQATRLRVQARAVGASNRGWQNRIEPARLGRLESTTLKEALRIGRELQRRLSLDYQL